MIRRKRLIPPKPIKPWIGPKPTLSMKIIPTCRVHFKDLEVYLAKVYRMQDYDIRQATGARADMAPEFIVTGIPSALMTQQMDNIRRGHKTRNVGLILNVLCIDGFIPVGKYVIDISEKINPLDQYREALYRTQDQFSIECLRIREKHRGDRKFIQQITIFNERINKFKVESLP